MVLVLFASACSQGNYPLPDRKSSETRAAEKEIKAILESDTAIAGEDPTCQVRYLGSEDGARFAWALCTGTFKDSHVPSSVSTIFRIVDDRAEWPRDSAYVEDVEKMFPRRLADDALNNPNRLKP